MLIDCARHAGVQRQEELFDYMPHSWRKHFDRYEWTGAIELASNHIRVSEKFRHDPIPVYQPDSDTEKLTLVIPYQGLVVNGWTDIVGAKIYLDALNTYAEEHWASASSKIALVVSPHDPAWSAAAIRRHAASSLLGGVAIPLIPMLLGTRHWDPIYEACIETNLPVIVHYSGVEGSYTGAAPLSGSVHTSALSRLILMPHLAESNAASLLFEGAFYRFPDLQVLFAGFGFKWAPSLLRRVDQEWRNFRSDVPWVKEKPSTKFLSNIWLSSYPVGEAANPGHWIGEFSEALLSRIVFNSHEPFGHDSAADVERTLGKSWLDRLMRNGAAFLKLSSTVEA